MDPEGVVVELPEPPRYLPKSNPTWTAINTSSTRFANTAMRKATKHALFRCRKVVSTSKELERLEGELDKIARQTKNDMMLAKVPKALLKDRRIAALEDVAKSLEQMNKKLKVSLYMENYLNEERERWRSAVADLEQDLVKAQEQQVNTAPDAPIHSSAIEKATRANRACPANCARLKAPITHDTRLQAASSAFLYNCRMLADST